MGTYHAIVFFPLIGAAIAGLFGRLIGDRQAEYVTTGLLILSALLSCISLINIGIDGGTQKIMVLNWISSGGLDIDWVLRIDALIYVERQGQKKIVIGEGGSRLRSIGTEARKDMEMAFSGKVMLKLWVKVKSGWSDDERALRSLGFEDGI